MKNLVLSVVAVLMLLSCKKEPPPYPAKEPPPQWKQFVGSYKVYDTTGVYLHDMEISHYDGIHENGTTFDSLLLENFAGMFDLKIRFMIFNDTSKHKLGIGIHNELLDHNNKRWHLSSWWDFPETSEAENVLVNDTIIFGYKLTNIAYYIYDITPYYACHCRQVAVKQN